MGVVTQVEYLESVASLEGPVTPTLFSDCPASSGMTSLIGDSDEVPVSHLHPHVPSVILN